MIVLYILVFELKNTKKIENNDILLYALDTNILKIIKNTKCRVLLHCGHTIPYRKVRMIKIIQI